MSDVAFYPGALKQLYAEVELCTLCRTDSHIGPSLRDLPGDTVTAARFRGGGPRFQFDFWPWLDTLDQRSVGNIRYLFLAMEPSCRADAPSEPKPGGFDPALTFSIETYLLAADEGYLITNMAKCSIPTGPICERTRERRWTICSTWLAREIECIRPRSVFSIGHRPLEFLRSNRFLKDAMASCMGSSDVQYLPHYSPLNQPMRKRITEAPETKEQYELMKRELEEQGKARGFTEDDCRKVFVYRRKFATLRQ